MNGQEGRRIVASVHDGGDPGAYIPVAGLRSRRIRLHGVRPADHRASNDGGWRRLIAGAGALSVEVSGDGMFAGGPSDHRLTEAFFARETPRFQLELADFGTLTGPFAVTDLTIGGPQLEEASLALTFQSAGPVTFAAT